MNLDVQIDDLKSDLIEVALAGALNTETVPKLEPMLADVLSKPVRGVRFDMARLNYISSMGIKILFNTFKALRDKNALFLVVNLQPQIQKVLDIARALPAQNIFSSTKEADAYFDAMQQKVINRDDEGD